jgi:hypothetical protein
MNPQAIPTLVLARAESVSDAIALLESLVSPRWGANYALVDASGDAAIVEKAGTYQAVRRARDGRLWCTNHSVTETMAPFAVDDPGKLQESTDRFEAIGRLSAVGDPGVERARAVLAHTGRPGAVCRYAADDPRGNQTEWAFIARPAAGTLEVCFSHPDRDPWHTFHLAI